MKSYLSLQIYPGKSQGVKEGMTKHNKGFAWNDSSNCGFKIMELNKKEFYRFQCLGLKYETGVRCVRCAGSRGIPVFSVRAWRQGQQALSNSHGLTSTAWPVSIRIGNENQILRRRVGWQSPALLSLSRALPSIQPSSFSIMSSTLTDSDVSFYSDLAMVMSCTPSLYSAMLGILFFSTTTAGLFWWMVCLIPASMCLYIGLSSSSPPSHHLCSQGKWWGYESKGLTEPCQLTNIG